mmetsp:Transcript_5429/g.12473  ORF Transcript_5429/g.12473 Transcript_5429/m.12473 type:complete len:247 (+) Transcript_5429:207-947(+)
MALNTTSFDGTAALATPTFHLLRRRRCRRLERGEHRRNRNRELGRRRIEGLLRLHRHRQNHRGRLGSLQESGKAVCENAATKHRANHWREVLRDHREQHDDRQARNVGHVHRERNEADISLLRSRGVVDVNSRYGAREHHLKHQRGWVGKRQSGGEHRANEQANSVAQRQHGIQRSRLARLRRNLEENAQCHENERRIRLGDGCKGCGHHQWKRHLHGVQQKADINRHERWECGDPPDQLARFHAI